MKISFRHMCYSALVTALLLGFGCSLLVSEKNTLGIGFADDGAFFAAENSEEAGRFVAFRAMGHTFVVDFSTLYGKMDKISKCVDAGVKRFDLGVLFP